VPPVARRRQRPVTPLWPVLLVVLAVVGAASAVGAQVAPVFPKPRSVWSASCVAPGNSELVVYGKGWGAGAVDLEAIDPGGTVVGAVSLPAVDRAGGAAFQALLPLGLPPRTSSLSLVATQGENTAEHAIQVLGSCSPTITATVAGIACALPGRPVTITATVRGAPTSAFDLLLHHADLYGPAEAVDRTQPDRPAGDYTFLLSLGNVPDRVVPVMVEARRPNGTFAFAATNVGLPPACLDPTSPTTGAPGTTSPGTTLPPSATTLPPPAVGGPLVPLRPSPALPSTGVGPVSLSLSPTVGRGGDTTTVTGRGFAPSSQVILRWRPGIGQWTVTAGGDGTFRTQVLVLPNDVEGPRVLEVLGGGGAAPAPFLVVPASHQPAFGGVFVRG
jgi:hypothetical protein